MWPGPMPTSVPSGTAIQPFGHDKNGLKMGRAAVPLFGEELGLHLTQGGLGRDLPPYQVAS